MVCETSSIKHCAYFQAMILYASFNMLSVTKWQHMSIINLKDKLRIRLVTNLKLSLHPGDTIGTLEGFLVTIHVLRHIVFYMKTRGSTWLIISRRRKIQGPLLLFWWTQQEWETSPWTFSVPFCPQAEFSCLATA